MEKIYKLIREMASCLAGVQVNYIDESDDQLLNFILGEHRELLRTAVSDRMILKAFRGMRPGRIYEIKGFLGICFLVLYDHGNARYLAVGPCALERLPEHEIGLRLRQSKLDDNIARVLAEYIRMLPIVPYETLHSMGVLIAHHLYGIARPVPYEQLDYQWDTEASASGLLVEQYEELDRMRRVELRYEISAALTEAVKQGNLALAYQMMRRMNPEFEGIVRNPNPLRNTQNMCIIMNTQLRHAMEGSGIHPFRLDRFSHEIALQIEKLRSAVEAERYPMEIVRRYCELARENAYPELKPFTRLAVTYIKEHLTDNLTVKGTARALLVNANYLSYQFHQDMGMTFIDFVNRERTGQAASLLMHTTMQIQQIAGAVGYNNTSYFSRQFVKYHHMTPRAYRNSRQL